MKYVNLLKYEIKTFLKDSLNLFMLLYPFIMLLFMGLVIPIIIDKANNQDATVYTLLIALAIAFSVGAYVTGALLGFSLIENKDEKTILSISVTPIKIEGYVMFKIIYTFIISIIGNFVIIGGLKLIASDDYIIGTERLLDNIDWLHIFVFSIVSGLFVPTIALIFASTAKNKIEGFAFVKGGGFIIMLPTLSLLNFFLDGKQYILGVLPNFWPIKAMLNEAGGKLFEHPSNINYYFYMLIGAIYLIFLTIVSLRIFIKKINMN